MPLGTPINRQFVLITKDGKTVIDWGNDVFQDVIAGNFIKCLEEDISHVAQDEDMEALKHAGCIDQYDANKVFLLSLPEQPKRTLD
jgi:hypothetical protein